MADSTQDAEITNEIFLVIELIPCIINSREVKILADQDGTLLAVIGRCIDGDNEAWESFCKEYSKIVRGYLSRLSYFRKKREAVDDVTQQVFVKLWNSGLRNFREKTRYQFLSYLKTIAIHEANTFIGKNPPGNAEPVDTVNGAPQPEYQAGIKERMELLERHLQRYSLEDQQIFILLASEYTYKEVGERLGLPLSTVAFRYSRIREGLQKDLGTSGEQ